MCKFNTRLFVLALYCLLGPVSFLAKPTPQLFETLLAIAALPVPQDVHYDQRQKGDENYRLNVDGFVVGLPQDDSSALLLITDDLFESIDDDNLLALGKNKAADMTAPAPAPASSVPNSNQNLSSLTNALSPNMVVEIPSSRKYLEARQNVEQVSTRTRSYISNFLDFLKRMRKN